MDWQVHTAASCKYYTHLLLFLHSSFHSFSSFCYYFKGDMIDIIWQFIFFFSNGIRYVWLLFFARLSLLSTAAHYKAFFSFPCNTFLLPSAWWLIGGSGHFLDLKVHLIAAFRNILWSFFAWKNIQKSLIKSFFATVLPCIFRQELEKALWLIQSVHTHCTTTKSKFSVHFCCWLWLLDFMNYFHFKI